MLEGGPPTSVAVPTAIVYHLRAVRLVALGRGRHTASRIRLILSYEPICGINTRPECATNRPDTPDFDPWSGITVRVADLTGKNGDFYKATEAAGLPRAWHDAQKDWTWHHVEDCETMQLVPRDLHAGVPHAGSAALFGSGAC